jgi:hypothetical protein
VQVPQPEAPPWNPDPQARHGGGGTATRHDPCEFGPDPDTREEGRTGTPETGCIGVPPHSGAEVTYFLYPVGGREMG